MKFKYYLNDSNDRYMKYYDYYAYKSSISWTHLFSDDLFGFFSFSRLWRDYSNRTITTDANSEQWDRTYVATCALYYNLNKDLTLGLNYTYRENGSNEPTATYSGSLVSLSAYYSF